MDDPRREDEAQIRTSTTGPRNVPLARQAVAILRDIAPLTTAAVFLGALGDRPMSNMTLNGALQRMGFDRSRHDDNGFRAMARTMLAERLGAEPIIEAQLAHAKNGPLALPITARSSRNNGAMMQQWAGSWTRCAREPTCCC